MRGEEEKSSAATEAHPPILADDARAVLHQMNPRQLKWKELNVSFRPSFPTAFHYHDPKRRNTVNNARARCGQTTPTS